MSNPINHSENWMGGSNEPLTGFSWKSGATRDTTGIILWSDVFLATNEIGEKLAIVLMDTQGLFDNKTTPADNCRIFALGTLISSAQIFNLNGVIEEHQLQYLQLATDFAKLAAHDNQQPFEIRPFQKLLFLIRDWSYPDDNPYGFKGGKSYLKKSLKIEKNQHESLKSVRKYIFSSFEDMSCCLLPSPGKFVTRANYDGSWSNMDEEFKDELKILIESLLHPKNLVIKKINNHEYSAVDLKNFIEGYLREFQSNEMIGAESLYELTITKQLKNLIQKGLQTYKEKMVNAECPEIADPNEGFNKIHKDCKLIAIDQFKNTKKMGSNNHHLKYQKELEMKIEQTFSEWKDDKTQNHEKLAAEIKKVQEVQAENYRLEQEQRKAYQENEETIREILKNKKNLTDQQVSKYEEIVTIHNSTKEIEIIKKMPWWIKGLVIVANLLLPLQLRVR